MSFVINPYLSSPYQPVTQTTPPPAYPTVFVSPKKTGPSPEQFKEMSSRLNAVLTSQEGIKDKISRLQKKIKQYDRERTPPNSLLKRLNQISARLDVALTNQQDIKDKMYGLEKKIEQYDRDRISEDLPGQLFSQSKQIHELKQKNKLLSQALFVFIKNEEHRLEGKPYILTIYSVKKLLETLEIL